MNRLLFWHILSEKTARRFCWAASFLILVACTVLATLMLPELALGVRLIVGLSLATGWLVLGAEMPRMLRGR
jgi:hypothetical protein